MVKKFLFFIILCLFFSFNLTSQINIKEIHFEKIYNSSVFFSPDSKNLIIFGNNVLTYSINGEYLSQINKNFNSYGAVYRTIIDLKQNRIFAGGDKILLLKFYQGNFSIQQTVNYANALGLDYNNNYLIATDGQTSVKLYTVSGNNIKYLKDFKDILYPSAVALSDKFIAVGDSSVIKIYDIKTFRLITTLRDFSLIIGYADFSPDGKYFAVAAVDKTLKIYKIENNNFYLIKSITTPAYTNSFITFSYSGKYLGLTSGKNIVIYDVKNGFNEIYREKIKKIMILNGMNFSADDKYFTVFWTSGFKLYSINKTDIKPSLVVVSKEISADDKILSYGESKTLKIKIKNNGNVPLKNINLTFACPCNFEINKPQPIDYLDVNQEASFEFTLKNNETEEKNCNLTIKITSDKTNTNANFELFSQGLNKDKIDLYVKGTLKKEKTSKILLFLTNKTQSDLKDVKVKIALPENIFLNDEETKELELKKAETKNIDFEVFTTKKFTNPQAEITFYIYIKGNLQMTRKFTFDVGSMPTLPDVDKNIPKITKKYNNRFALVIGAENYKKFSKVNFALNDARIFSEYAKNVLGIPENNIYLLTDPLNIDLNPSSSEILYKIKTRLSEKSELFIFYAGHGLPDEYGNPQLLPIDAYINNRKLEKENIPASEYVKALENAILLGDIIDYFNEKTPEKIIVFMDACFSGKRGESNISEYARSFIIVLPEYVPPDNSLIFTAVKGNKTAYPIFEKNHGLFTYSLLKTLKETKGFITYGQFFEKIKNTMAEISGLPDVNIPLQEPDLNPTDSPLKDKKLNY